MDARIRSGHDGKRGQKKCSTRPGKTEKEAEPLTGASLHGG